MADNPTAENMSIALFCPDCGHKNPELVAHLQTRYRYACRGAGCAYVFEFTENTKYGLLIKEAAKVCAKIDALPEDFV
jgi:hypothetical protein